MKKIYLIVVTDMECGTPIKAFEKQEVAQYIADQINLYKEDFNMEEQLVSMAMRDWQYDNPWPETRTIEVADDWSDRYQEKSDKAHAAVRAIYGKKYVPEYLRAYLDDFFGAHYSTDHHNYRVQEIELY